MATKSTKNAGAKAPTRAKRATTTKATPTHEEIATRAYFIAEETGSADMVHNWLRAETELSTQ